MSASASPYYIHTPVLLSEVLDALSPKDGGVYVDGTFGNGGYTRGILEVANCEVIAIDRDPSVKPAADKLKEKYGERFTFIAGEFGNIKALLNGRRIDGFVIDIGVSSMQIDQAQRGFSFQKDGPLDMRMSGQGQTAADIVNTYEEQALANLIYKYGEERKSRHIAYKIIERRAEAKFETTTDLANIVRDVVPKSKDGIDPATRTFQALRIAVNDELGELERALKAAQDVLNAGGRMVVVSFHSLEDTIVKRFFREKSGAMPNASRYAPQSFVQEQKSPATFSSISKKAIRPSHEESAANPRARSARLRWAEKAPLKSEGA